MKKLFLIAVMISTSIMCSCQTEDVFEEIQISQDSLQETDKIGLKIEKYMDQNSPGVSLQGAASYGDYLFQFENYNANVYIYNLRTKEFIEKVSLTKNSNNHCNNASFSNIFYEEDDEFPLLYVSGGIVSTYNHIQVYRILLFDNRFTFEKIQEIEFPKATDENKMHSTQAVLDDYYMYVLTKGKDQTFISKFEIPDYKTTSITLAEEDILEQVEVKDFIHKQGAIIRNGFLYILYGVPAWGDTNYLRIIDLSNYEDTFVYNLSELGFRQEFEGLSFYNESLIVTTNSNAGIFIFHFTIK